MHPSRAAATCEFDIFSVPFKQLNIAVSSLSLLLTFPNLPRLQVLELTTAASRLALRSAPPGANGVALPTGARGRDAGGGDPSASVAGPSGRGGDEVDDEVDEEDDEVQSPPQVRNCRLLHADVWIWTKVVSRAPDVGQA